MKLEMQRTDEGDLYVPDYPDDNRAPETLERGDQWTVRVLPASARDLQRLEENVLGKITKGAKFMERANRAGRKVIENYIGEVRNLELLGVSGRKYQPKNGKELAAALEDGSARAAQQITDDLIAAIQDASHLAEGLEKKLLSPSVSSSADQKRSNGAAPAAKGSGAETSSGGSTIATG